MPSDPVSAGRKGGSRNTPAQQEARRRNGFQPSKNPNARRPVTVVVQPPATPRPNHVVIQCNGFRDGLRKLLAAFPDGSK
jgi:hypothetical protein